MKQLLSKSLKEEIQFGTKQRAARLIDAGIEPSLAVILVGDNPDSLRYIAAKTQAAKESGILLSLYHLEKKTSFEEVKQTVAFLNADEEIDGIIVQLPLPEHFTVAQTDELLGMVSPEKDVDGLSKNWQRQSLHEATLLPPMVQAITSLLESYHVDLRDQQIALVGKGRLVGEPLEAYFQKKGVAVTSVDEETNNILDITKQADLLIAATGQKDLITYQWVKEGAIVIDCAEDVHEDSVTQVASALAPARGGVGPLTVAWLLRNTVIAAEQRRGTHA